MGRGGGSKIRQIERKNCGKASCIKGVRQERGRPRGIAGGGGASRAQVWFPGSKRETGGLEGRQRHVKVRGNLRRRRRIVE